MYSSFIPVELLLFLILTYTKYSHNTSNDVFAIQIKKRQNKNVSVFHNGPCVQVDRNMHPVF